MLSTKTVGSIRTGPQPGGHCSDGPAERTGARPLGVYRNDPDVLASLGHDDVIGPVGLGQPFDHAERACADRRPGRKR
jgi:hypothetical protein